MSRIKKYFYERKKRNRVKQIAEQYSLKKIQTQNLATSVKVCSVDSLK